MELPDPELKPIGEDMLEAWVTPSTGQEHTWRVVFRRAVDRLGQPWQFEITCDGQPYSRGAAGARQGYASPALARQAAMFYIATDGQDEADGDGS
jgi:hypothetical protein